MRRFVAITIGILLLCSPAIICGQDDDVPLGDLARAARKARPSDEQTVIDNDNLNVMMDQAESERLNGKPVFSIDPSGNAFRMTSPDGTCSLSFDAKATALISTPFVTSELPQDALLKVEGPATIHDGLLEVSLHNGTGWELKEIVVAITVLQNPPASELRPAKLIGPIDDDLEPKLPDLTMLYHLKATSPPDANTVFRADLGGDIDSGKHWRWALVGARGIPPAAPGSVETPLSVTAPSLAAPPGFSLSETKSVLPTAPAEVPAAGPSITNQPTNGPVSTPSSAPPSPATPSH